MKVSVIIPNYRHADYLPERIESVLKQSYQDFEVILLDDASPDDSVQVLERYRNHPKVSHLVINAQNSGSTFRQWERGFALARGEYIWIAESDDFAEPDFLASCMAQFEAHPSCVVAYTESRLVDSRSRPLARKFNGAISRGGECDIWSGEEFVRRNMLLRNAIYNASMALFRKSAIPKNQNHTQFRLNGDWLFWCEICSQGDVAHINRPLNAFRQHEAKATVEQRRNGEALAELVLLYDHIFRLVKIPRQSRWAIEGRIAKHIRIVSRKLEKRRRRELRTNWRKSHPSATVKEVWSLLYSLLRLKPLIR